MAEVLKLEYKGLDDPFKFDEYIQNAVMAEDQLRDIYIKRLNTFNRENLKNNPEPFRFLKKENCSILFLIQPYDFNYQLAATILYLSTPGDRKKEIYVLKEKDLVGIDNYINPHDFLLEEVLPSMDYDKSQVMFDINDSYEGLKFNNSFFRTNDFEISVENSMLVHKITELIRNEVRHFKTLNTKPLSYFAKDAHKFPFSILDLKPLMKLVEDEDFNYQLDQAMAAYHSNLFLPCAATLGVVLETLCLKILEHYEVKKVKTGDTQLGKLRERLVNERITSRRDNTRLEVAYKMRNMASHTSPGIALKEDCHFMLNVINTLAFEYLNGDQSALER
ncbi:hypothetical protein RYX56_05635 [Alkalihalophilus lindianensis]|uniref:DUF4145 domain-containing protein n=1 Tax=Alkalihalophilus lindianensis TaxID=1630542 RepID=A0ABU3X7H8_9BACI|nr:hypothetical protein [Alkalihalophilus lindianensis]MDV2683790.1 hypothetical protein [Alkalihalophilus lindianensis]MDV2683856.1 hypothetical protein [Alkalihalophilus lindianensis]